MLCGYDAAADRYLLHDPAAACSGPIALCATQVRCRGHTHVEEQIQIRLARSHTLGTCIQSSNEEQLTKAGSIDEEL